jgi:hypothetical protein
MQKNEPDEIKRGKGKRLTAKNREDLKRLKDKGTVLWRAARRLGIPVRTAKRWWDREAATESSRGKRVGLFSGKPEIALVELARMFNCSSEKLSLYARRFIELLPLKPGQIKCKDGLSRALIWRMTKDYMSRPPKQKGWPIGAVGVHAVVVGWRKHDNVAGEKRGRGRPKVDPTPQKSLLLAVADRNKMDFVWDLISLPCEQPSILTLLKNLVERLVSLDSENLTVWLVTEAHDTTILPTIGIPTEAIRQELGDDVSICLDEVSTCKGEIIMDWAFASSEELKDVFQFIWKKPIKIKNIKKDIEKRPYRRKSDDNLKCEDAD